MHLGASNTVYSPPLGMKCQSSVLSTQVPLRRDVHGFSHMRCHSVGGLLCPIWCFTMVSAQTASLRHEMSIYFCPTSNPGLEWNYVVSFCVCVYLFCIYIAFPHKSRILTFLLAIAEDICVARWSRQMCGSNIFWHKSYKNIWILLLPGDQGKYVTQILFGTTHIRILLLPGDQGNCVAQILFVAQLI